MASSGYNPTFPGKWIGLHFMFGFVNITLFHWKSSFEIIRKELSIEGQSTFKVKQLKIMMLNLSDLK